MPTEEYSQSSGEFPVFVVILWAAVVILTIAGMWTTFKKAGRPGWAAIIPFYNMYVATEVAQLSVVWFVLLFIPVANLVATIMISIKIAENFGKGGGFGIGLWLLPVIFYPILGFGSAKYLSAAGPTTGGGESS
ncbi:MAG: signal peptidase I [Phycisphaerae bacterium]|nr:signal peptidase I [Phycisphaerae bacterium]